MNDLNITELIEGIKPVITWMDWITIIFSFITMFFVLKNWFHSRKELDKIKIFFKVGDKEKLIESLLARKDTTRSEIQGVLRTKLKKGVGIYDIPYLATSAYMQQIYDIQNLKSNQLIIEIEENEFSKFDI